MEIRRLSLFLVWCLLLPILPAQVVSAQRFGSTDVPKPILDNTEITSTLDVPSFTIADVNLVLDDLEHTCLFDLRIELTSPVGTKVSLIRAGNEGAGGIFAGRGCLEDFANSILDDQAPSNLADGAPPFMGSFNIEHESVSPSPLSTFNDEDAGGIWTLSIADRLFGDTGTLKAWSLEITPLVPIEEREALIAFYESTGGDDWDNNTNWRGEYGTECSWQGVRCEGGSVTEISLETNSLTGMLPAAIRFLTNLSSLALGNNQLSGPIPAELGQLTNLSFLDLTNNQLSGPIPAELGQLANLETLALAINELSGTISPEFAQLSNLQALDLALNQLSGTIPPELAQLSNLRILDLAFNQLAGTIPAELGQLTNLQVLDLALNQLSGTISPELAQLSNLEVLILAVNQLSGTISPELAQLSNLRTLNLRANQLGGIIPPELGQLPNLRSLDLQSNQLSGPIPPHLGELLNLEFLLLSDNQLSGTISPELARLSNLRILGLGSNQLSGPIPRKLSELSNLALLSLSDNELSGSIPPELGNLSNLMELYLGSNQLSGPIPPELGNLSDLIFLGLGGNQLSGPIPPELGNLAKLEFLELNDNQLSGQIPLELAQLTNLIAIDLRNNRLFTDDEALRTFLNSKQVDGDWESTQWLIILYFAQFADGVGLSSQITVSNATQDRVINLRILLRDDNGQPLTVDLNGEDVPGVVEVQVPASGLAVFETDGLGPLQAGSVTVLASRDAAGVILFAGAGLGLAGVGSSVELPMGFSTPIEVRASSGINTGIAVQNVETDPVDLTFELLDPQGILLATSDGTVAAPGASVSPTGISVSPVPGLGHFSLFATELAWDMPLDFSDFRGTLRVLSNGRIAATAIQTRPGQFATLPVIPR